MLAQIRKWGNSLAVRIPKAIAEDAGLTEATSVAMSVKNGEVRLIAVRPRWNLREMLARVTRRNVHEEISAEPGVGREVW